MSELEKIARAYCDETGSIGKLILGDCLERMKEIPDNSIDMVLTDCPYKIVSGGRSGKGQKDGGIFNLENVNVKSGKMFKHNTIKFSEWLPDVFRVLKEKSHCYIMINGRNLSKLQVEAEKTGLKFQNLLLWEKNNVTINRYYMQKCEFILMLKKGGSKTINNTGTPNILKHNNIIGNKTHPSEKPIDLLEVMIGNSSLEGETVLDLFMGSGSTGVACKNLNRNFIGIEKDREYFRIAKQRIKGE